MSESGESALDLAVRTPMSVLRRYHSAGAFRVGLVWDSPRESGGFLFGAAAPDAPTDTRTECAVPKIDSQKTEFSFFATIEPLLRPIEAFAFLL
jgi:hypothetical protein